MEFTNKGFSHLVKDEQVYLKKWNKIVEFKDCPPLNKKVLATHDNNIYIGVLEKDGDNGYCWKLENENGIEWVEILDVELWVDQC